MQLLKTLGTDGLHYPVLDVVVPVTTAAGVEGHTSVQLEVGLRPAQYWMLLAALAAAGIVEQTFVKESMKQRA